jgi:glucokinase
MVEKQATMNQKRTYAVGVDLGATTIKTGVVDNKGKIIEQVVVDTKASKGPRTVIQQIVFSLEEIFAHHQMAACMGIGIGSPGVISVKEGTVLYPPNFTGWEEVELAKAIRKVFPLPVFLENDANCAAIAEGHFGAGMEYKDFLFVIWGTGVGGGIILDKKIYRGPHGGAGEIGHVTIDYNGPQCNCGNKGCIESFIGQKYLSQRTRQILESEAKNGVTSKIENLVEGRMNQIEPAIISKAAEENDPIAQEILTEAGELLGYALVSAMNILDLRVAIIGGGISAAPRFVFEAIEKSIKSRILKPHRGGVRVRRAVLGNGAGLIGAASLVYF